MNIVGKRIIACTVFILTTISAISLYGCETEAPEKTTATDPLIGVLLYKRDDTYITLVTETIKETLAGWAKVEVLFSKEDQQIQNEQIDTLLKKRVNALAVNIVNPQAAAQVVDTIKKAGIPVVFFNREPDLNTLKTYDRARFVGTTALDAGIMQGDIITGLWRDHPELDKNKDGKCQYLMLQANLDNPEAVARTEYSVKQARDNGIIMQQADETLLCNWDDAMAYEAVRLVFPSRKNAIELIIANNDSMALGAIKALNESGYNLERGNPAEYIPVVGVDAVPQAIDAIKKGMMSGTVRQDADAMGKTVGSMLLNILSGADYLQGLPCSWDDSDIGIRIPYSPFVAER